MCRAGLSEGYATKRSATSASLEQFLIQAKQQWWCPPWRLCWAGGPLPQLESCCACQVHDNACIHRFPTRLLCVCQHQMSEHLCSRFVHGLFTIQQGCTKWSGNGSANAPTHFVASRRGCRLCWKVPSNRCDTSGIPNPRPAVDGSSVRPSFPDQRSPRQAENRTRCLPTDS